MNLRNEPLTPGWHFAGLVAGALMELGRARNARAVASIMASQTRFDDLVIDYYRHWLRGIASSGWQTAVYRIQGDIDQANLVQPLRGRSLELIALIRYATGSGLSEQLADDLRPFVVMDASALDRMAKPVVDALKHQTRREREAADRATGEGEGENVFTLRRS